jgi:hypothetical protein
MFLGGCSQVQKLAAMVGAPAVSIASPFKGAGRKPGELGIAVIG